MKHCLVLFAFFVTVGLNAFGLACASAPVVSGAKFTAGFSSRDSRIFVAPPSVARRPEGAFLVWTYGTDAFYFYPEHRVVGGRLVFALAATSSSGSRSGRRGEVRIEGAESIAALRRDGVWWWEPDGSYTRLAVTGDDGGLGSER